MLRLNGLVMVFGLLAGAWSAPAAAFAPQGTQPPADAADRSSIIQVQAKTDRQKCHALNRCRARYTRCFNKLEAQHRLADKDECVKPYQKCIHANFSGTEFFFERWFVPDYIDCSKY